MLLLNSLPAQFVTSQQYGRNSKHVERLADAVPTTDGGLLVGGYKEAGAQGVYDIFLQKFGTDGTEAWLKTIGRDSLDVLTDLVPANGGGFLLSGYTLNPDNGSFDALLAKVDEQGNLLWWRMYGGPATEIGLALCQLSDQNIVLAGSTITVDNRSAHFRALFDAEGKLLDAANTMSSRDVSAIQLEATSDGGFVAVVSNSALFSDPNVSIHKYHAALFPQWEGSLKGIALQIGETNVTRFFDVKATVDGIFYCFEGQKGVSLVRAGLQPMVLWYRKMGSFGMIGAGLKTLSDGSVQVGTSQFGSLLFRKLSPTGITVDSVGVPAFNLPYTVPLRFVFSEDQHCYLAQQSNALQQEDYLAARVKIVPGQSSFVWQKKFGIAGTPDRETADAIAALPDGGFLMAGTQTDSSDRFDLWILRADPQGKPLWERTLDLAVEAFDEEEVLSMDVDQNGNTILLAATDHFNGAIRLLKFSPAGDLLFNRLAFDSTDAPEFARVVALFGNKGYVACFNAETDRNQPTLMHFDSDGNVLWRNIYTAGSVSDVAAAADGTLFVAGTKAVGNQILPWLFKTDADGNTIWEKTYPNPKPSSMTSLCRDTDGSLFMAGAVIDGKTVKALVIKTDADGNLQWRSEFTKGNGGYWVPAAVLPNGAGGCTFVSLVMALPADADLNILLSIFRFRTNLVTLNDAGALVCEQQLGTDETYPIPGAADIAPDGNVLFCATMGFGSAYQDAWVLKSQCLVSVRPESRGAKVGTLSLSPNPAINETNVVFAAPFTGTIRLRLLDAAGREVLNERSEKTGTVWQKNLPLTDLPPGMYWIEVNTGLHGVVKPLIIGF